KLDVGLEELRRRGLLRLTDWMPDVGQGDALTAEGEAALTTGQVPTGRAVAAAPVAEGPLTGYQHRELVRNALFEPTPPYVSRVLLALNLLYFAYGAFFAWSHNLVVGDYLAGSSPAPDRTTTRVILELGGLHDSFILPDNSARPEFERIILS